MSIIVADSGSTKTAWRIVENNGAVLNLESEGINPYFLGENEVFEIVYKTFGTTVKEKITEIFFYGAGVTSLEKAQIVKLGIKKVFEKAQITVLDDMLGAAKSLCLTEPGIACILGTGCNSAYYDGQKITHKVDVLGFWLGDEGSGAYLGKELVKKYLRKEWSADILVKFEKRFGVLGRLEVLDKAHKEFPNRYFAGFSKFLWDYRREPEIYLFLFDAFSLFFEKNINQYPEKHQVKVNFTGSVAFYYSDILKKVAKKYEVAIGVISEGPIAGLTLYHKQQIGSLVIE